MLTGCGEREAKEAVAATFADPPAVRFQSVERHGEFVCGEVNPGGGLGYTRFIHGAGRATVAPRKGYSAADLAGFDTTCRMLGGEGTAFDREACTRADDARRNADLAETFERKWEQACRD